MPLDPELFRALGTLCESPDPAHAGLAEALGLPNAVDAEGHTRLFVFQLVPYASVYLGPEGMLGGEARDRIAGFWRALRLTPPAEPDHLAALLGLYASLLERERDEAEAARRLMWHNARRVLLWDHLLTWVPPYVQAVTAPGAGFHTAWARLLMDALSAEAREVAAPASLAQLRDVPGLDGAAPKEFIRALLAPARSGVIITRDDLARGARTMGLGLRLGERAFILRSFIDQDPVATFGWLAEEATAWEARHTVAWPRSGTGSAGGPGAAFEHWRARAALTHRTLTETRHTAMEVAHAT